MKKLVEKRFGDPGLAYAALGFSLILMFVVGLLFIFTLGIYDSNNADSLMPAVLVAIGCAPISVVMMIIAFVGAWLIGKKKD
jgi:hypothetical protein